MLNSVNCVFVPYRLHFSRNQRSHHCSINITSSLISLTLLNPPKFTEDKMNGDPYHQNKVKVPIVPSRRGRNFLLHNLEESDVVFGTKGNGRNEIFLKVLESHSEQYVQLPKFQKMGLIQKIIREWKGNFYIMNSKTNDLYLAKRKDHDLSTKDPSSRKLYTSVRRMMNYVNSKIQRQPYHPQRSESVGPSALIPRTSTGRSPIPTPHIPTTNTTILTKKEHRKKSRKNTLVPHAEIANLAAPKKYPAVMTTKDYIESSLLNFPFALTCMNISTPKRSAMSVTPEPSPRVMLQSPPPISPIPFSKPVLSHNNIALIKTPYLPLVPFSSATVARNNATKKFYSKQQAAATTSTSTTTTLTARNKKIKKHLHVADNTIGDLEECAILALTSLGSSSSIMSS
jgi:hypothetical protein